MTDKEKIKEEIESYKESMKGLEPHSDFRRGQITAYNQIMQFIDSLPEEPASEDLEEEINRVDDWYPVELKYIQEIARHFAEWQKQRDKLTWVDMNQITACYEITKEKFGTGNYTDKEWGEDILKQYKEAKKEQQ